MLERYSPLQVKVWGDYALFTQPEAKVERVSYPCMTPSAARGILEAIFWKPEFQWNVRTIQLLKPIKFESVMRNEVSKIIAESSVKGQLYSDYCADEDRQQRNSLFLRDVAYLIEANIVLHTHVTDHVAKYRDMFRRRVKKGQCFHQPYLGTRECVAYFSDEITKEDEPIKVNMSLGNMLFDLKYPSSESKVKYAVPCFFSAELVDGVLSVPKHLYQEV